MTKDNVVNLSDKRKDNQQEEALPQLPEHVEKELQKYEEWIEQFTTAINAKLFEVSEQSNELRDISLPLESLIRVFSDVAEDLDLQVPPEQLGVHTDLRVDLANTISREITGYMKNSETPLYQQDVFLAMSYVLISYLYQQRVYVLMKGTGESENTDGEPAESQHQDQTDE
jgi:hypothetical protein